MFTAFCGGKHKRSHFIARLHLFLYEQKFVLEKCIVSSVIIIRCFFYTGNKRKKRVI